MTHGNELAEAVGQGTTSAPEHLAFHRLSYLAEADEVTVGRVDTGTFIVLPRESAELLRQLENGTSCSDAADWYERTYQESVDVPDFVAALRELGFIREADDGSENAIDTPVVRWRRLANVVFSPIGLVSYLVLVGTAIGLMVHTPALLPTYRNLLFTQYASLVVLTLFVAQTPLVLLHEAAHALAGRRLGLPSKLRVGRRFYFVVFETNLDGLVAVPRRKRYLPILAGLLTDVGVIAALTLIAAPWQRPDGSFPAAAGFALAMAYTTSLRAIWQFWFFLQTDLYYLVVTVLGCIDLQTVAKQRIKNRVDSLRRREPRYDSAAWHPRDAAVARWYSVVVVLGYAFFAITLVGNLVPAAYRTFHLAFGRFSSGGVRLGEVADSALFSLMIFGELAIAGYLSYRERHQQTTIRSAQSTSKREDPS